MKIIFLVLFSLGLASCAKKTDDLNGTEASETAQQLGDVMASVDDAGGLNGTLALMQQSQKTFARLAPEELQENFFAKLILPQANATTCDFGTGGYGACSGNTTTRTFSGCSVNDSVLFTGTVTTTWGGGSVNCVLNAPPDMVTRVPNYTVQGRRAAILTVTKTGAVGQRLTWASGTGTSKVFNFTSDGINRKFTNSASAVTFDYTTTTTAAVTVTGTQRLNRVMTGGILRVRDNLAKVNCDYVPTNVTWGSASCNCPTSGSWAATCTRDADNSTYSSSLVIKNSCGTATFSDSSGNNDVKFDRCGS